MRRGGGSAKTAQGLKAIDDNEANDAQVELNMPESNPDEKENNPSAGTGDGDAGSNKWTKIENWPVNSDAARDELASMTDTHCVNPIPAYDMHRYIIHPTFYRTCLVGAIVELNFELTHWAMKSRNSEAACDTYTADIVAVHVLVPPKPTVITPRKRKVFHKMDPLSSPSPIKKPRLFY
ncbi:hypothetical protein H0H92_006634 [Tricholoma furcatifolium]|nr:hypothetical protein H0H92_006634 [Tricholoma furcatifolium]